MRPVETLLLLASLLAFAVLVIPRFRKGRRAGYVPPVALSIAVVQILAEGARRQMVPAYALSGGGLTGAQIIAQYNQEMRAVAEVEEASRISFE